VGRGDHGNIYINMVYPRTGASWGLLLQKLTDLMEVGKML